MLKSVKLFLLLVLVFFLTDRTLFFVLKSLNESIYTGQGVGKVNTFLREKDSVDVLVFGSSRAAHHVNLDSNEISCYNMGKDATKIAFSGALISTLKKQGQLILVHIDHDWLYERGYDGNDLLPLRFNALINSDIRDYFKHFYSEEYILSTVANTYACNGKMLSIIKNTFIKGFDYFEYQGFEPIFPTAAQQLIFKNALEENSTNLNEGIQKPLELGNKFSDIVSAIVAKAAVNNSKLIFFTTPSLNKVDHEIQKATRDFFETKGLTYWDHTDYFKEILINDWKDHTHLSSEGAEKYSQYLRNELQKFL